MQQIIPTCFLIFWGFTAFCQSPQNAAKTNTKKRAAPTVTKVTAPTKNGYRITITSPTPNSIELTPALTKYNKIKGVFVITKDDGGAADFSVVAKELQNIAGTDGCGNVLPYSYNFAVPGHNDNLAAYKALLEKGHSVLNHSNTHSPYVGPESIHEATKKFYNATGRRLRAFALPVDYWKYTEEAIRQGYIYVESQGFGTEGKAAEKYRPQIAWGGRISAADVKLPIITSRENWDNQFGGPAISPFVQRFIDSIIKTSTDGKVFIGHGFGHGPGEKDRVGFRATMLYIRDHPENKDRVWVAGAQEMAEYYEVRIYLLDNPAKIKKTVSGNQAIFDFDLSGLPAANYMRDMSFMATGGTITNVTATADRLSFNKTTGLINVFQRNKAVVNPNLDKF